MVGDPIPKRQAPHPGLSGSLGKRFGRKRSRGTCSLFWAFRNTSQTSASTQVLRFFHFPKWHGEVLSLRYGFVTACFGTIGNRNAPGASAGTTGCAGFTGWIRRYADPSAGRTSSAPLFG